MTKRFRPGEDGIPMGTTSEAHAAIEYYLSAHKAHSEPFAKWAFYRSNSQRILKEYNSLHDPKKAPHMSKPAAIKVVEGLVDGMEAAASTAEAGLDRAVAEEEAAEQMKDECDELLHVLEQARRIYLSYRTHSVELQ